MRYISIRPAPTAYVKLNDVEDTVIKCLDLEYVTCSNNGSTEDCRLLYYLKNDIDFSVVNPEYLASYDLVELSASEAVEFAAQIYRDQSVSIDEDGLIVVSARDPFENKLIDFTDKSVKPYRDAVWDEERRLWVMPIEKLDEVQFTSTWADAEQKWISECNLGGNRFLRSFHIWNAREIKTGSPYDSACSSTNYAIQSMEEVTHGTDSISTFVLENATVDTPARYPKITKHFTPIDLSPVAMITYQEYAEEDHDVFADAMKIHPQCAARTIDELFRLIVEWAWSYTELGNTEPMAALCHDILRVLQMPLNVREDLLSLKPQPVARFILGDTDALVERDDPDQMPESFRLWISDVYYKYRSRTADSPLNVNIDSIKESYPT